MKEILKKALKCLLNAIMFILTQITKGIIVTVVFLLIIVGGIALLLNSYKDDEVVVKSNSYLALDFSKGIIEKKQSSLLDFGDKLRLYPILEGIKEASKDDKIKGIYLDINSVVLNANQMEEVGYALENFKKSGKKVYAFTKNLGNQNYSLGLYADTIGMPPIMSSSVAINGYHREFNYFKNLADFVGVKFNVIHIGDYKAYGEQYSRDAMSDTFREDVKRVYDMVYDSRISTIAEKRNLDKEKVDKYILEGKLAMSNPIEMKKMGIIDELDYKSEFLEKNKIVEKIKMKDYLASLEKAKKEKGEKKAKDKIAIIYAEGDIVGDSKKDGDNINTEDMLRDIKTANDDKDVKGIVMRVNSPGGLALTAEIIHHELSKVKKPIYVSMGGVAASGGYYISSGADKIFATKMTITGSIGVVSVIPNASQLAKNLKINVESLDKGKLAGAYSITTEMSKEEIEAIRESSIGIYNEFKDRVSKGRNISLDDLEKIAGGRMWLGEEGVQNKLVDQIGGLEDTIDALSKELKLDKYQVVEISDKKNLIDKLVGVKGSYTKLEIKAQNLLKSPMRTAIKESTNYEINTPLVLMPYDFN